MIKVLKYRFRQAKSSVAVGFRRCWRGPVNPVLIYQMGKVASSSIYSSLRTAKDFDVFHVHRLNPDNIELVRKEHVRRGALPPIEQEKLGLYLYDEVIKPRRKTVRIISLVREPIGRNISAFFENMQSILGMVNAQNIVHSEQLIAYFLRNYHHDVPLTWFDIEMRATTGIDVYKHRFPYEQGYQIINAPPYHLLIMRCELDDGEKEQCIAEFLDTDSFQLSRSNEAISKEYADAYQTFIDAINVPAEYADRMLSSRYAQHFYSREERQAIHKKWTKSLES